MSAIAFQVMKLHKDACIPSRANDGDAGYDLYAYQSGVISPKQCLFVPTGVAISAPVGYYYTIEARSSLSRSVITIRNIIDATYCGEILVGLWNFSDYVLVFQKGDRIAQLIPHAQVPIKFDVVDEFGLEYSSRGLNGFGSSGR